MQSILLFHTLFIFAVGERGSEYYSPCGGVNLYVLKLLLNCSAFIRELCESLWAETPAEVILVCFEVSNCSSLLNLIKISVTKLPRVLYKQLCLSSDVHDYHTRHATGGRFSLPKVKTSMVKNTAMYRALVTWNSLPEHIIQENIKNRFKISLKQHLLPKNLSSSKDLSYAVV